MNIIRTIKNLFRLQFIITSLYFIAISKIYACIIDVSIDQGIIIGQKHNAIVIKTASKSPPIALNFNINFFLKCRNNTVENIAGRNHNGEITLGNIREPDKSLKI